MMPVVCIWATMQIAPVKQEDVSVRVYCCLRGSLKQWLSVVALQHNGKCNSSIHAYHIYTPTYTRGARKRARILREVIYVLDHYWWSPL